MKKSELRKLIRQILNEQGPDGGRPRVNTQTPQTGAMGTSGMNTGGIGGDKLTPESAAQLKRSADQLSQAMGDPKIFKNLRARIGMKIHAMILELLGDAGIIEQSRPGRKR